MGFAPEYILVDQQKFSKAKLSLDNHVYKNCEIDDCDVYYSGGQYELIDTHITNSRLILNHPAKRIEAESSKGAQDPVFQSIPIVKFSENIPVVK